VGAGAGGGVDAGTSTVAGFGSGSGSSTAASDREWRTPGAVDSTGTPDSATQSTPQARPAASAISIAKSRAEPGRSSG
jgi:hypothetical protein